MLLEVFPTLSERLRITQLCEGIGLAVESVKRLFNGEVVTITGKLHSPEHDRSFDVQDAKLQIFAERDNSDKLLLKLNGQNIFEWFKKQYQEVKQLVRSHVRPISKSQINNSKGIKR